MNKHTPRIFGVFAARMIIALVAVFGSLTVHLEAATYCNETQPAVDSVPAQTSTPLEPFSDALKTFNDPNAFAAAPFGMRVRPDTMLRDGSDVAPPPIGVWVSGDYGEDKGRSYLEGGMSAQFVFRKNARYPLIVTVPMSIAAGDEEYWFGPPFGYVTTGVNVRVPLSFIPSRYGRWTASSSVDLEYYGTTAREFMKSVGLHTPKIAGALSVDF